MSTRVSVVNLDDDRGVDVRVMTKVDDGREMRTNGVFTVKPGAEKSFLLDGDSVLQLSEGEEE